MQVRSGKVVIHNSSNAIDLNKDEAADIGLLGDARSVEHGLTLPRIQPYAPSDCCARLALV